MATKLAQNVAALWIGAITTGLIILAGYIATVADGGVADVPAFVGLGIATGLGSLGGIARGEQAPPNGV